MYLGNFEGQDWRNLENVNQGNMQVLDIAAPDDLSAFFNAPYAICSGPGFNLNNKYGQVGTTAQFNFPAAIFKFITQAVNNITICPSGGTAGFTNSLQGLFAQFQAATQTITIGSGPYVTAQIQVVAIDSFRFYTTCTILPTTQSLAAINANTTLIPLFILTDTGGGVFEVSVDSNCAFNYGYYNHNPYPDIVDVNGGVSIIGPNGLYVNYNFTVVGESLFGRISGGGGVSISGNASGDPTAGYVGSNNTGPGGFNGIHFDDRFSLPFIPSWQAGIGDSDDSIATYGALPSIQVFNVLDSVGNAWQIIATTVGGPFPGNPVKLDCSCASFGVPPGGASRIIDLAAAGILSGNATVSNSGPITIDNPTFYSQIDNISLFASAGSALLGVSVGNTGAAITLSLTGIITII